MSILLNRVATSQKRIGKMIYDLTFTDKLKRKGIRELSSIYNTSHLTIKKYLGRYKKIKGNYHIYDIPDNTKNKINSFFERNKEFLEKLEKEDKKFLLLILNYYLKK